MEQVVDLFPAYGECFFHCPHTGRRTQVILPDGHSEDVYLCSIHLDQTESVEEDLRRRLTRGTLDAWPIAPQS